MENSKESVELISKVNTFLPVLGYAGTTVVIVCYLYLYFLYFFFGIHINNFIDFSEVIILSLNKVLLVVFAYSIVFFYKSIYVANAVGKPDDTYIKKILTEESTLKRYILYIRQIRILIFLTLILGLLIFIVNLFSIGNQKLEDLVFCLLFCLLIIGAYPTVMEVSVIHYKAKTPKIKVIFSFFLLMLFLLFPCVFLLAYNEKRNIEFKNSITEVSITLDNNRTFISDDDNYYVGKTKNYLFIRHNKDNEIEIIPTDRITQMTFKNRVKKIGNQLLK